MQTFERDQEATCKTCTWWKDTTKCTLNPVIVFKGADDWCAQHTRNKLAEQRWIREQESGPVDVLLGDVAELKDRLVTSRKLLTDTAEQAEEALRQLAACAAGPWEDYDPGKHKDGKVRLMEFCWVNARHDPTMVAGMWNSGKWSNALCLDLDINRIPTRVAELRGEE